jgi:hypothetical protein
LAHDLRFLATTVSHSFIAFGELLDLSVELFATCCAHWFAQQFWLTRSELGTKNLPN